MGFRVYDGRKVGPDKMTSTRRKKDSKHARIYL